MDTIHNPSHYTREQIRWQTLKKKKSQAIVFIYGQPVFLIRIRIDFGRQDPGGQKWPTKIEKGKKF